MHCLIATPTGVALDSYPANEKGPALYVLRFHDESGDVSIHLPPDRPETARVVDEALAALLELRTALNPEAPPLLTLRSHEVSMGGAVL